MMIELAMALAFVALGVVAFVVSVRLGMLLGRRLDLVLEAHASAGGDEELEASRSRPPSEPAAALQNSISVDVDGLEE
jgi:hypothetical protein